MNKVLILDTETHSSLDLIKCGVHKYTTADNFAVDLLAYKFNDDDTCVIDLANGEVIPDNIKKALEDPSVMKVAHNCGFDATVLVAAGLLTDYRINEWTDTSAICRMQRLPGKLGEVARILELPEQKNPIGATLINKWGKSGPTEKDLASDSWKDYKEYCKQDVEVCSLIYKKLGMARVLQEQYNWEQDQLINDIGIAINEPLVDKLIEHRDSLIKQALDNVEKKFPGLNIASQKQVLELADKLGHKIPNYRAETIEKCLQDPNIPDDLAFVLTARQVTSLSSLKKLEAIKRVAHNGRCKDLFFYYGAGTGRWAGRMVQLQNLPKGTGISVPDAANKLANGTATTEDLKTLIRPCFIASDDKKLIVSDFASIEARVLAWLANEKWLMGAFANGQDVYKVLASQMYHIPVDKVTEDQRQHGKAGVLACGYQGGPAAIDRIMPGAFDAKLRAQIVSNYRSSSKEIVKFWRLVEQAFRNCLVGKRTSLSNNKLIFTPIKSSKSDHPTVMITLPSGRNLYYYRVRMNGGNLAYLEYQQDPNNITKYIAKENGFPVKEIYGGVITENITQAVARDLLGEAIQVINNLPEVDVVGHVHDEILVEAPVSFDSTIVDKAMHMAPDWAQGLALGAKTYESKYYTK